MIGDASISAAGAYGALWPVRIKILVVIDGRVVLNKLPEKFGLGFVFEALEAPFAPYVQFTIDVAKHDGSSLSAADLGGRELRYPRFRFTKFGFDLDDYDQVWFFADQPSAQDGDDGVTDDGNIAEFALEFDELRVLAQWMKSGGGVFAAGDHSILGASLCSKIPRVRTMRKWRHTQGVPPKSSAARHETLQPGTGPVDPEADTALQPVELVLRRTGGRLPFSRPLAPHPILTTAMLGPIDRFPDHMHEGEVIADSEVPLDLPLEVPGQGPEYPSTTGGFRPRPHVIAFGRTTNPSPIQLEPALRSASGPLDVGDLPMFTKRFGLVGTYDGDRVGLGRVVVDSTWHHWFSFNLVGIAAQSSTAFLKMQTYYRNVALWLATPAQRFSMMIAGIWSTLTLASPEAFSPNDSPWQIGEGVLARLRATTPEGMLDEWVAAFLDPGLADAVFRPEKAADSEPSWSSLPQEMVNRAIVGGIGSALVELVRDDRNRRARGERPRLDPEVIRQRALDGVHRGRKLIMQTVHDAASAFGKMQSALTKRGEPPELDIRIPLEVRSLRVVIESLQVPDPADPALKDGQVVITIRTLQDGDPTTPEPGQENFSFPTFEVRAGYNELNRKLGEVQMQTGESLTVEVLVGKWGAQRPHAESIRFTETLRGDARNWVGSRTPARSHAWRLWYRIEDVGNVRQDRQSASARSRGGCE
jgi:hypothetical protein